MHSVQNPRMPLRFIVLAMFIVQLNTRRSVFSAAHTHRNDNRMQQHHHHRRQQSKDEAAAVTLGAIFQRDATLRHVAHLKATMDATSLRIQSLEKELSGMRKVLSTSENVKNSWISGKSESFQYSSERKVERGQRGSVSLGSLRDIKTTKSEETIGVTARSGEVSPNPNGNFGRRLMKGLKNALRVSVTSKNGNKVEKNGGKVGDVIVIKKDQPFHHHGLAL